MIGFIRLVGAVALFVAMVLANLVYADTFSPATVAPGGSVTLSGQAKPNSSMSGYFSCSNRCGQTHIGVATANAQGQYSLTFNIPATAKPGGAYVQIGCDRCGNGWRTVSGLQVAVVQSPQPSTAPTPPSNGLSASAQQRVLQVSQQLRTNGTNLLAVRNQVINSLGANNAQQIVPIIETISNNYIAIGNKANSITVETKAAIIADLNTQRNELDAKKTQAMSIIDENNRIITAQQPAIDKQMELQRFWESDRDKHARISDDLARKCRPPLGQWPDAGACVNWPLEATAIEGAKAKIALAVTQIAVLQAAVAPNHINKMIAQVSIDLVYAPQISWINNRIAELQNII